MCGRFSVSKKQEDIESRFGIQFNPEKLQPRWNAAPSQLLPVVTGNAPQRGQVFRWGFVPPWAKDERMGYKMINARLETVLEKRAYKNAFATQRCLVIADGYYEWRISGKQKIPHRIILPGENLFAMAGIWEQWQAATGSVVYTFAILTQEANPGLSYIHERMPVILAPEDEKPYLSNDLSPKEIPEWLEARPPISLQTYTVGKLVNTVANEGAELFQAVDYPEQQSLF
ncbi:SOS response-associated peptidase [Rapidithrix thailandica]|uniref:Abasic site processing protein n=1 Tax=Rapidithrix thailandica TaxID=413964 RepID=A0AAW9S164_9BACT